MTDALSLLSELDESSTALVLPADITRDEYEAVGAYLGSMYRKIQFAMGDYIVSGEKLFGEDAYQLSEALGISPDSRQQYVRVALAVEPARRRAELTWSHHRAVASLSPADQDRWLADAVENGWTRGELDDHMHSAGNYEPRYTDRDLLRQIAADIRTYVELTSPNGSVRALLDGVTSKIAMHERGEKWWLEAVEA